MTRGIFLIFIFLLPLIAAAQDQDPRALYNEGKFAEALAALQARGVATETDHFNVGNCLFKLGRFGAAVAHYEKARSMGSSDSDLEYNLSLAKKQLEASSTYSKDASFWRGTLVPLARKMPEALPLVLLLTATLWLLFVSLKAVRGESPTEGLRSTSFILTFICWITAAALCGTLIAARSVPLAVVEADAVVARSGPSDTFTELFKLSAGTSVEITENKRSGWVQIRFSLGNTGWVMEKDLLQL